MNIHDFLQAARLYLFGLPPQRPQPVPVVIPTSRKP
jgi:hypothetical protein